MAILKDLGILTFVAATGLAQANGQSGSAPVTASSDDRPVSSVTSYRPGPLEVSHDLGACDGPLYQAIFEKAVRGQTEVKPIGWGPFTTGYTSTPKPDANLIRITPNSVSFGVRAFTFRSEYERAAIATALDPNSQVSQPSPIAPTAKWETSGTTNVAVNSSIIAPAMHREIITTFTCK